jgi:hypothetical protein
MEESDSPAAERNGLLADNVTSITGASIRGEWYCGVRRRNPEVGVHAAVEGVTLIDSSAS